MTDGGTAFQPGAEKITVPFRPRGAYAGYRAFGSGDGAVLVEPRVTRALRAAAEYAAAERRIAGGLLFGRGWADDQGAYLVVDGFLEAGPGENPGDQYSDSNADSFTLAEPDLRLLREDAARMYSASLEVGWWRTLPALGEFGPVDFATQIRLVGPDGVGLLVYGSGQHWGTAYLGPDGDAPDAAGTLVVADQDTAAAHGTPAAPTAPAAAQPAHAAPPPVTEEPELVDLGAGESLVSAPGPDAAQDGPQPADWDLEPRPEDEATLQETPGAAAPAGGLSPEYVTEDYGPADGVPPGSVVYEEEPAPGGRSWQPTAERPPQEWGPRPPGPSSVGPKMPTDVKLVVGALILTGIIAAVIVGAIFHSAAIAFVVAIVALLAVVVFVAFSRL